VKLYEIFTVPAAIPYTPPVPETVAVVRVSEVQLPPLTVEVRRVESPIHTERVPLTIPASGSGVTVINVNVSWVPQLFVYV
jgi:hypothetical protein